MSGDAILIAALSARALTEAARRAGFRPLAVDFFGDEDTRAAAAGFRQHPGSLTRGFRAGPLLAALEDLAAEACRAPVGLVLGAGFEDAPDLVAVLAERFPLLGNGAAAIRRCKDPAAFFDLLDRMGLPYPETRTTPPSDPAGWLVKRAGGSGGLHVRPCPRSARAARGRYFQRRVPGEAVSVLAIAGTGEMQLVGLTRQWCAPAPRMPYRYGGAAGPLRHRDADLDRQMCGMAARLASALELVGLVSFDFLVAGGAPLLIEVNPRPSATLDIFEDAAGSLFLAHVRAARAESGIASKMAAPESGAVAAAYVYADNGPLRIGSPAWPAWVRDRPRPGTRVSRCGPVATVTARAETPEAAIIECQARLGVLAEMLYGQATGKDAHQ